MKNLTPELIAKAKAAKSAEELLALAEKLAGALIEADHQDVDGYSLYSTIARLSGVRRRIWGENLRFKGFF